VSQSGITERTTEDRVELITFGGAGDQPGGMMRYGIPAYRMPRDVLDGRPA
jgi:NADPH-dependent glutamate synthase beta subunit-like oxidoreductase